MQQYSDQFQIINGPEDGTEFPITRTPLDIGSDAACAVHIRLDQKVNYYHARVTVVSDGYRIRRLAKGPVFVNGKRAGVVRSRVIRSGGVLRVGSTALMLQCAPEGRARRSHGLSSESDYAWAARFVYRGVGGVLRAVWQIFRAAMGNAIWIVPLLIVGGVVLGYYRPYIVSDAWRTVMSWWWWLRAQLG